MPLLAKEFGLKPWDFGGEQVLTHYEAEEFMSAAKAIVTEHKKAAQKAKRSRSRR